MGVGLRIPETALPCHLILPMRKLGPMESQGRCRTQGSSGLPAQPWHLVPPFSTGSESKPCVQPFDPGPAALDTKSSSGGSWRPGCLDFSSTMGDTQAGV